MSTLPLPAEAAEPEDMLRVAGWCVLPQRLPRELVEELLQDIEPRIASAGPEGEGGFQHRRLRLSADGAAMQRPSLWGRPEVLAVVRSALGPLARVGAIDVAVNLPGSAHQPSHMDCGYLFEDPIPLPAFAVVLNIPLVDIDDEIGPLELWPATHRNPGDVDQERIIAQLPSQRPHLPAGALLLRDIRLWHRGTPNRSARPRPQVGIAYSRPWYGGPGHVVPAAVYDALAPELRAMVGRAT
jgi:hypothetical protein